MTDLLPAQDRLGLLDPQAVTAVYNQYFPEVYRYVQYRLGDDALAEDIASEVFFSLLKSVKAGRAPETNLRGWLIGAARHMVVDQLRRKYRHPSETISETLVFDGDGPVDQVERRDDSSALRAALTHLTEDQQQVLMLRFVQGYSLEETASVLRKKVNAVKALQFRALASLQRWMGDQHE
jgi:RNA polymerase sigma-70 factor, ECF subfamily